jgi:hypothetical protein
MPWWLVEHLARTLEPSERDAVLGDFKELNVTRGKALRGVLGLVARRQAALWNDWRPWVALLGLAGIVGIQLNQISSALVSSLIPHLLAYWNHGVRYETGLTLAGDITVFATQSLALLLCSWTSAFVLGALSRRTLWINGTLFYLLWLFPNIAAPPLILLLLPSIWGMRLGRRVRALKPIHALLLAATTATAASLATWTSGWWTTALATWSQGEWQGGDPWPVRLIPFAIVSLPAAYILVTSRNYISSLTK